MEALRSCYFDLFLPYSENKILDQGNYGTVLFLHWCCSFFACEAKSNIIPGFSMLP